MSAAVEPGSIVACLGASTTAAIASYDWVADLRQRPALSALRFRKFARGGDLAYNGLQRVPAIIACRPRCVVVLLGGNDVLSLISRTHFRLARLTKRLPQRPSLQWYRDNMQTIVRHLREGTAARIGLCSLIPLGEEPDSRHSFQAAANHYVAEYSATVRAIASEEGVGYIPLYERLRALIVASPGRALTRFSFLPFYRDAFRQFALGQSHDEIGRRNSWRFHRDGIHLNSVSGKLLADLVEDFIGAGGA
jgi:lysophospholipase L1-like esterase